MRTTFIIKDEAKLEGELLLLLCQCFSALCVCGIHSVDGKLIQRLPSRLLRANLWKLKLEEAVFHMRFKSTCSRANDSMKSKELDESKLGGIVTTVNSRCILTIRPLPIFLQ